MSLVGAAFVGGVVLFFVDAGTLSGVERVVQWQMKCQSQRRQTAKCSKISISIKESVE
jgi:hypothetical protein